MKLAELFADGRFVITSEAGPPKGVDTTKMLEEVGLLRDKVDAFNVTDQQSSVMRLGSLAVSHLLKKSGAEPIFQLTCRDRNRIALQSDLLSAYVLGIENVLCLTGDYVSLGDHPAAKPVFDLDSVSLIHTVKTLCEGHDLAGKELSGKPDFCIGAVVSPGANPLEPQIIKMESKIEAGAQFFQTQAVYSLDQFSQFMKEVEHLNVPVLGGIILLKSAGMARFMNSNVAGVFVPDDLIDEMDEATDRVEKSVEIGARLIKGMKDLCQGVHIMALGWEKWVPDLLREAGL
ncbi:MAG: 5,10-methylenetetrahydrofolate reductase [Anaerolineae bacterium]|nr:5,10-methylenetetrahydrofolate reductase [Anaerolineae bacterium]NIN95932.1 5,10-methylenetetrahydrofolate reductase [Anaerolineae bacterium]NIQ78896.1 5,10-methylenetetrahydrofolate reductase [Anaerolineae bacterium]